MELSFERYDRIDWDLLDAETSHECLLNQIMERSGHIKYTTVDLDSQRKSLYAALREFAYDAWVPADIVSVVADIGDGNMDSLLEGLCHLRELEMDVSDEGELVYKLTDFGKSWIRLFSAD